MGAAGVRRRDRGHPPGRTPGAWQFAETAQRTLAADFAALGHQESFDTAIMLWGIISTMLSGAIHNGYPIGDAYRVADAFIDLVASRLPADQRSANTGG